MRVRIITGESLEKAEDAINQFLIERHYLYDQIIEIKQIASNDQTLWLFMIIYTN